MMCTGAMLAAIAAVLMFLDFPLPFLPSFYKIDFSELPVLIGAYAMGPVAGVIIEAFKILVKFLIKGTLAPVSNMPVGFAMDFNTGYTVYSWLFIVRITGPLKLGTLPSPVVTV